MMSGNEGKYAKFFVNKMNYTERNVGDKGVLPDMKSEVAQRLNRCCIETNQKVIIPQV